VITTEKIKSFEHFKDAKNSFARINVTYYNKLLENSDWTLIDGLYQDIQLINDFLVAEPFIERVISNLREECDEDVFYILTSKINFYRDFQKIADILRQIKSYVSSESDTTWAGFDNAEVFLKELNQDITAISNCSFLALSKVYVEFLPTCSYQEISISNGWGDDYINLSNKFDRIHRRLTERMEANKYLLTKARTRWWQRIFNPPS